MNTKIVTTTETNQFWDFPILSPGGTGRILTKHYTNLTLIIDFNELALLSWLIYQSNHDNSFKYTSNLILRYTATIKLIRSKYKVRKKLLISSYSIRKILIKLIQRGFLLRTTTAKLFLINPCLTYSKLYVKGKYYDSWIKEYNHLIIELGQNPNTRSLISAHCENYIKHVDQNL